MNRYGNTAFRGRRRTFAAWAGVVVMAAVVVSGCCGGGAKSMDGGGSDVAALEWMIGEWSAVQGDGSTMTEKFWRGGNGEIIGTSRMVGAKGEVQHSEEIKLVAGADGRAVYRALPQGRAPHDFPMVSNDGSSVVFEDKANDFPSWIRYSLQGDTMKISLKGAGEAKDMEMEFELRRAGAKK